MLPIEPINSGVLQFQIWQVGGVLTSILGFVVALVIVKYGYANPKTDDKFLKNQLKLQPFAILEYVIIFVFAFVGNLTAISVMMIWMLLSGSYETWLFFSELE